MDDQFSAFRTMLDYGRRVADDEGAIEFSVLLEEYSEK